eukprot:SAG31_NODE_5687_length_2379_cov_11.475439_1_plen_57_part_10
MIWILLGAVVSTTEYSNISLTPSGGVLGWGLKYRYPVLCTAVPVLGGYPEIRVPRTL